MRLPITKPLIGDEEQRAVVEVLSSGWLVQGPRVQQFEASVADFVGARHAIAVNSCTSGQFIMSRVAQLGPGDEAIVPSFTWISTVNAVEFTGATPVLCDVDLETFNIDIDDAAARVTPATRAIVPVHLFGLAADMRRVHDLVRSPATVAVIEDCACALGARIDGRHCGLDGLGGILSFHPRKSITTGEGGMILTNHDHVARLARSLRDHGAVKSDLERHGAANSFLLADYPYLGYNWRLTDVQGALGAVQMTRVPAILARKQALAAEFADRLQTVPWLRPPVVPSGYDHGYQAYCTLFKAEEATRAVARRDQAAIDRLHDERNVVMRRLEDQGVATRQGTHAVHLQLYYREKYNFQPMDLPASYAADRLTVALPFYPQLSDDEVGYLFDTLASVGV